MAENSTDLVDCSGLDIPNDKFKIFYVVILVADLAVLFGGLFWWYKRRHTTYLKNRNPELVLFMCIGYVAAILSGPVFSLFVSVDTQVGFCFIGNFGYAFGIPAILSALTARAWVFKKRIAYSKSVAETLHIANGDMLLHENGSVDKSNLPRVRSGKTLAIALQLFALAGALIYSTSTCPVFFDVDCQIVSLLSPVIAFVIALAFVYMGFFLYIQRMVIGEPDPLGILKELKTFVLIGASVVVIASLLAAIDPGKVHKRNPSTFDWACGMDLAFLFAFIYAIPYQVYLSYDRRNAVTDDFTMAEVLQSEIGSILFENHLVDEFSIENLTFVKAVERWEAKFHESNDEIRKKEARNIYTRWLSPGAVFAVNASGDDVEELFEKINRSSRLTQDTFVRLKASVLQLMEFDSFQRFKRQPTYQDYFGAGKLRGSKPYTISTGKNLLD